MKKIYVVRHCQAEGQAPDAPLTAKGLEQADMLLTFLGKFPIERVISSPYQRAIQTIQPLAEKLNLKIEMNNQLKERVLSDAHLPDWVEKLKATFENVHLKFPGGESSEEAANRIVEVVEEVLRSDCEHTVVVTHGNLLTLLLNYFDNHFGFTEWSTLSNPDVYVISSEDDRVTVKRTWDGGME